MAPAPAPPPAPSNSHYNTRGFLTKLPPGSRVSLAETIFVLTPAGGFVGFTENDKLCFYFFLLFPLPATAENDSEKTKCPSPFCYQFLWFSINGPECPERFHHPRLTKVPPASRRTLAEAIFLLPPAGACFFLFPLAPLSHHLYQLSQHLYRQRLATRRSIARSIARSLGRSLDRSIARSLGRSIARSLDRSVARTLGRSIARSLGRSVARSLDRSIV